MSNIIKVRDNNGNWLGIPALKGVDGITPHIGENGNWFIGADDTGVAAGGLTELPIASADTLGAVKIGNNLTIDENGVLNGNDVDLTSYAQKSELPTKVSDLTNDSLFITNTVNNLTNYYTKTETYTQEQINNLISAAASLKLEVVSVLPTTDISTSTIYLKGTETTGTNDYEEWIYVNNNWELIGTTAVDLTNYTTKEYVDNSIAAIDIDTENRIYIINDTVSQYTDDILTNLLPSFGPILADYLTGRKISVIINIECDSDRSGLYMVTSDTTADKLELVQAHKRISWDTGASKSSIGTEWYGIRAYVGEDVVPSISWRNGSGGASWGYYLATGTDYETPYVPEYDGSPATKKYVDDTIASVLTDVLGGEY